MASTGMFMGIALRRCLLIGAVITWA